MSTVESFTKARLLALEAETVVGGHIDSAGHLILEQHDGSMIDAGDATVGIPDASTTQAGTVELATAGELAAGTDSLRAITTDIVFPLLVKVLNENLHAEAAAISTYPSGISEMPLGSGSGWSIHSGFGTVITYNYGDSRSFQWFHAHDTNETWKRRWYQVFGWSTWEQFVTTAVLASMSSTQKLWWGGDTNLYRSAANVLKTDDAFVAAAGLSATAGGLNVAAGGATITAGGLTVSASGAAITGNSTVTGNLNVTGSLTGAGKPTTQMKFTSSSPTNAIPTGAKKARVRVWGGGAAGGGAALAPAGQSSHGGGGQAGGYSESLLDVSAFGGNIAVVIGAAGVPGSPGDFNGGNGGATTVNGTLVTAPGGIGGDGGQSSTGVFGNQGGDGGTAGFGDIATVGAPGVYGFGGPGLCVGGIGGSTLVGSGGRGPALASAGQSLPGFSATGYGAGGGGAAVSGGSGTTNVAGGAGTPGLVLIEFYY